MAPKRNQHKRTKPPIWERRKPVRMPDPLLHERPTKPLELGQRPGTFLCQVEGDSSDNPSSEDYIPRWIKLEAQFEPLLDRLYFPEEGKIELSFEDVALITDYISNLKGSLEAYIKLFYNVSTLKRRTDGDAKLAMWRERRDQKEGE
jgi:hypothetical protein